MHQEIDIFVVVSGVSDIIQVATNVTSIVVCCFRCK